MSVKRKKKAWGKVTRQEKPQSIKGGSLIKKDNEGEIVATEGKTP